MQPKVAFTNKPPLAEEECRWCQGFAANVVDGASPRSGEEPSGSIPPSNVEPNTTSRDKNPVSKCGSDPDPTAVGEDPAPTTTEDKDLTPTTTEGGDQSTPTATEPTPQPSVPAPNLQSLSGNMSPLHPSAPTCDDQDAGFAYGCAIPGSGVFTFNGTAKFITSFTINYLETVPSSQHWTEMVRRYLQLEQLPIPKGVSSLPTYYLWFHADHIHSEPATPPNGFQARRTWDLAES